MKVTAIITLLIIGATFIISCASAKTSATSTIIQTPKPIAVTSVVELPTLNPAGPNIEIILKNVSNVPVVSLAALLKINNALNKPFEFNFAVSQTSPLLPGTEVSSTLILIGGGFINDNNYPLEIIGLLQTGENFDYTTEIKITESPTNSATSITPSDSGQTLAIGSNVNGLELKLMLDRAEYNSGDQITIAVDEKNTLNTENNIKAADKWQVKGLNLGPCGTINYPFGIVLLQGNYDITNLWSIPPLQLYDPNGVFNCPMILAGITSYEFQPNGDAASIFTNYDTQPPLTINMNTEVSASGSWSGSPKAIFSNFSPGIYTVVGGDEWGTLAIVHLTIN